jgi:hypothetical protein
MYGSRWYSSNNFDCLLHNRLGATKILGMKPDDLLDHYKNQAEIARALDVAQPSVFLWFKTGVIPPIRQLQIEQQTRGVIKADPSIPRGWPKREVA